MISILHVVIGEIVPKSYTLPRAEQVALAVAPADRRLLLRLRLVHHVPRLARAARHADARHHDDRRARGLAQRDRAAHAAAPGRARRRARARGAADDRQGLRLLRHARRARHGAAPRHRRAAGRAHAARPRWSRCCSTRTRAIRSTARSSTTCSASCTCARLFVALQNGAGASADLRALLYPAHLVPETKRLGQLLTEIRRQKGHMAIVVDEYGSVAGLVTLEDLLEEIVGEIDDEFDPEDAPIVRLGPDRYRVEGSLPVEEFNERFERDLSDEDYHTVGGIVFGELGRAPAVGDSVEIGHVKFDVADGRRHAHPARRRDAAAEARARATTTRTATTRELPPGARRRGLRAAAGGAADGRPDRASTSSSTSCRRAARTSSSTMRQRHDRRLAGRAGLRRRPLRPVGADGVLRRVVAPDHERLPARERPPHRLEHAGAASSSGARSSRRSGRCGSG